MFIKEYKEDVDIDFLCEAMKLSNFNQYAGRAAQPLISGSRIYPIEIYLPPLTKQRQFSEIKQKLLKLLSHLKFCDLKTNDIFNALSQKAFSGSL